jgi:hypothetical protein
MSLALQSPDRVAKLRALVCDSDGELVGELAKHGYFCAADGVLAASAGDVVRRLAVDVAAKREGRTAINGTWAVAMMLEAHRKSPVPGLVDLVDEFINMASFAPMRRPV